MPPRFAYWTILIDDKPTAFRASERDELIPTFQQLRRKNPTIALKWFARGRIWESREAEREAQQKLRQRPAPTRTSAPPRPSRPSGHRTFRPAERPRKPRPR